MFGTKKITVCDVFHVGITATIFSKTGKGLTIKKKVENTSFQTLRTEFGIKQVRILLPEQEAVESILKAAFDAGIVVEASEPPSVAMARMSSHVHEPFILVYPPVKPEFICAIQDGNVLEVSRVDPLGSLEDTKNKFIKQLFDTQGITVKAIATNIPDPIIGLAMKKDEKKRLSLPLPIIIGSIVFLVLGIGFFSIKLRKSSQTVSPQVILVPTPTPAPIVRTDLKIEVQNGSGEAGLAGKGKKVLETLGYTIVTTANADNYEYQGVTVKGKTATLAAFIISDIKETYKNASASSVFLNSTSPVDVVVILGKE